MFNLQKALTIKPIADYCTKEVTEEQMAELYEVEGRHLMLEAVTLEDVELTYFDHLEDDAHGSMMLEAIKTTKMRLDRTMLAFVRALNQQMKGAGIEAGAADVGKMRKTSGLAVIPAVIALSDGQSITVMFHSPTNDPSKIATDDTLVAFRFLLNKRDVTHVVSPDGGRDISLKQTCVVLSNLAERNSGKFKAAQERTNKLRSEIDDARKQAEVLEEEAAQLIEKGDKLKAKSEADEAALIEMTAKADKQEKINADLRSQIEAAKAIKQTSNNTDDDDASNPPAKNTNNKDAGSYYYGLRARPAAAGSLPTSGMVRIIDSSEFKSIKGGSYLDSHMRHGVAVYDRPLTEKELNDYELVDLNTKSSSLEGDYDRDTAKPFEKAAIDQIAALNSAMRQDPLPDGYTITRDTQGRLVGKREYKGTIINMPSIAISNGVGDIKITPYHTPTMGDYFVGLSDSTSEKEAMMGDSWRIVKERILKYLPLPEDKSAKLSDEQLLADAKAYLQGATLPADIKNQSPLDYIRSSMKEEFEGDNEHFLLFAEALGATSAEKALYAQFTGSINDRPLDKWKSLVVGRYIDQVDNLPRDTVFSQEMMRGAVSHPQIEPSVRSWARQFYNWDESLSAKIVMDSSDNIISDSVKGKATAKIKELIADVSKDTLPEGLHTMANATGDVAAPQMVKNVSVPMPSLAVSFSHAGKPTKAKFKKSGVIISPNMDENGNATGFRVAHNGNTQVFTDWSAMKETVFKLAGVTNESSTASEPTDDQLIADAKAFVGNPPKPSIGTQSKDEFIKSSMANLLELEKDEFLKNAKRFGGDVEKALYAQFNEVMSKGSYLDGQFSLAEMKALADDYYAELLQEHNADNGGADSPQLKAANKLYNEIKADGLHSAIKVTLNSGDEPSVEIISYDGNDVYQLIPKQDGGYVIMQRDYDQGEGEGWDEIKDVLADELGFEFDEESIQEVVEVEYHKKTAKLFGDMFKKLEGLITSPYETTVVGTTTTKTKWRKNEWKDYEYEAPNINIGIKYGSDKADEFEELTGIEISETEVVIWPEYVGDTKEPTGTFSISYSEGSPVNLAGVKTKGLTTPSQIRKSAYAVIEDQYNELIEPYKTKASTGNTDNLDDLDSLVDDMTQGVEVKRIVSELEGLRDANYSSLDLDGVMSKIEEVEQFINSLTELNAYTENEGLVDAVTERLADRMLELE